MFIILYVSGLPTMWALMRQKPHDEIEEIMSKSSGDHEIYLVKPKHFILIFFFFLMKRKMFYNLCDLCRELSAGGRSTFF